MEETYDNMLKRLRMYRLKHGMMQAEFGRLLGMSQAEYSYKESGKLIISLDDNDLIKMIYMKENGEEPSDYLLDKVEQILMSVSK